MEIRHGDHIGLDQPYDVNAEHPNYEFPPLDLLIDRPKTYSVDEEEQAASRELIVNALRSYQVEIEKIKSTIGPTVTLYEIVPAQGTRISKIRNLEDDIAMNLSAPWHSNHRAYPRQGYYRYRSAQQASPR